MQFCPMCGEKIPSASTKFCSSCGIKLENLQRSHTTTSEPSAVRRAQLTQSQASTQPENFDLQSFVNTLVQKYGAVSKIYFNLQIKKNQTKIFSAQKAYAPGVEIKNVIFVFDDTLFGSAKDGILVTDKSIYVHNMLEQPVKVDHDQIENFSVRESEKKKYIFINETIKINLTAYEPAKMEKLLELLREINETFSDRSTAPSSRTSTTVASILPQQASPSPLQRNSTSSQTAKSERDIRQRDVFSTSQQDNNKFELKEYIRLLTEQYGTLSKVYFKDSCSNSLSKIKAARKTYAKEAVNENAIFVFDDTTFGAADDGFLVTNKNIYVHNMDEEPFVISHGEIDSFSIKKTFLDRKILINNSLKINLSGYSQAEANKMIALLKEINAMFRSQTPTPTTASNSSPTSSPPQDSVSSLCQDSNSSRTARQEENRRDFGLDDLSDLPSSNDERNEGSIWDIFSEEDDD